MYIDNKQIKNYILNWLISMFFIISLMIVVGGLTRLTDSGLSITEWQLFSGIIPPLSEDSWIHYFNLYKQIPEYKLQNYSMNMEEFKIIFWWEWIHRFLGRLIALLYIVPLIFFTLKIGYKKLINLYIIFFLICFQGFLGWYMVSSGLIDKVDVSHFRLSAHLIIAFLILSLLLWNYLKLKVVININQKLNYNILLIFLILIFIQILIGAFVSGLDAGQIYNSWPLMGTTYFPNDNEIFSLFYLSAFSDPSIVQFIHRNLAYVILIFYFIIFIYVYKKKISNFYYIINLLGIILTIQIILGIVTLLSGAQIILASMHQISSIFLVSTSVYLLYLNSNTNQQLSN